MAELELRLSEAWVRRQPALRGLQPEQVHSLSLQGTYAGKIVSLGDGLKSFKNLLSLDLSKNLLVSLEGLEYLQSLEHLNLYYNRISSLLEVARLQALPHLRELDLRLNPITRNESNYRLFTLCRLKNLKKLDDRTIRDSERKASHLHFGLKNKDNVLDKEKSRENTMRSQVLDQESFAVPSLDTENNRIHPESSMNQLAPHHMPYNDGKDCTMNTTSTSVLQASKLAKESNHHHVQTQIPLEDVKTKLFLSHNPMNNEYKPLSSTTQARTSLHSHVRSRAGPGKGKFHVSFSEDPSLDFSQERETGRKLDILDLGQDVSPNRRLNLSDSGKSNPYELTNRDLRIDSYEHLCLPYSTHYRELIKRLHNEKRAAGVDNYTSRLANEVLATSQSSCGDFLGQHLEMELDHACSDTKLNCPSLPLTNPTSTNCGDFPSKRRPLSSEVPLENLSLVSTLTSVSWKGRGTPSCRSLSPSRVEFKHTNSQHSPVSPKHCFKEPSIENQPSEQSNVHIRRGSPISAESPIIPVLRQLLELVDRYWNGSGSLLLNKDFLAPARDLLAHLMAAAPSQHDVKSIGIDTPGSNSSEINYRIHRDQPTYSQTFNNIDKSMQKLGEGQMQSFKERGMESAASSKHGSYGIYSLSYDELLNRNEQLSAQMDVLMLELKQLKKQQETINLLRESQRSLVSTNNFLLQQLNKEHGPSLLLEKTTIPEAHTFELLAKEANRRRRTIQADERVALSVL